jgi:hypothetical protein
MKKNDSFSSEKNSDTRLKVDLFSAESINYGHSALDGPAAHIQHYGYSATRRSAEKNGDTWCKMALFSATVQARTFFH